MCADVFICISLGFEKRKRQINNEAMKSNISPDFFPTKEKKKEKKKGKKRKKRSNQKQPWSQEYNFGGCCVMSTLGNGNLSRYSSHNNSVLALA